MSSDCNRLPRFSRAGRRAGGQSCRSAAEVSLLAASHFRELRAKCPLRQCVRGVRRPSLGPSTRSGDRTCRPAGTPPPLWQGLDRTRPVEVE